MPQTLKSEIEWSPDRYSIAISRIEGFDAVYHLAGESIASGRWNDEKKKKIRESRTKGTKSLSDALANLTSHQRHSLARRRSVTTAIAATSC